MSLNPSSLCLSRLFQQNTRFTGVSPQIPQQQRFGINTGDNYTPATPVPVPAPSATRSNFALPEAFFLNNRLLGEVPMSEIVAQYYKGINGPLKGAQGTSALQELYSNVFLHAATVQPDMMSEKEQEAFQLFIDAFTSPRGLKEIDTRLLLRIGLAGAGNGREAEFKTAEQLSNFDPELGSFLEILRKGPFEGLPFNLLDPAGAKAASEKLESISGFIRALLVANEAKEPGFVGGLGITAFRLNGQQAEALEDYITGVRPYRARVLIEKLKEDPSLYIQPEEGRLISPEGEFVIDYRKVPNPSLRQPEPSQNPEPEQNPQTDTLFAKLDSLFSTINRDGLGGFFDLFR
ncbi:MAG: hypothetical protein SFZ03_03455 [Candidatus Melainabacteria bacterium]|nr:hypothetical protein [Candidatus Melainabacteria bacterium]